MKIINIKITITFFLILSVLYSYSQNTKKATEAYSRGMSFYYNQDYTNAEKSFLLSIELDSKYTKSYEQLADVYIKNERYQAAAKTYRKLTENCGKTYPYAYFLSAAIEMYLGNYQYAKETYETYIGFEDINLRYKEYSKKMIKQCSYAINAIANPVPFNPINLGDSVNSKESEYLPSITVDEQTLIITRLLLKPNTGYFNVPDYHEDFFVSHKNGEEWTKAKNMGKRINTTRSEGAQTISANGKYMFFTACNRDNGKGDCDIYFTKNDNGSWLKPMNLGSPINTSAYEGQPSISPDGKTLYFISNRTGSMNKSYDIWTSTIGENGKFSTPKNIGTVLNTAGIEQSPFIHTDNQTLYFASDGHQGMGNLDIFVTKKDLEGNWQEPKNLGYPINTSKDDFSLIVNALGNIAYFSSERDNGYGKKDLYMFELYKDIRPTATTYFKGKVFDAETKDKLKADFELIDIETNKLVMSSSSDKNTGEFFLCLPIGKNYALNVSKDGYLFFSENFSLKKKNSKTIAYLMDVPLQAIKVGQKVVLKNIFFDTNKYDLKPESESELQKLIAFLNSKPNLKVEIGGHTDNVGTQQDNKLLSENRAKAVYNYLIENSIGKQRLSYKGYGELEAIANNNTDKGRALNRRTEFMIVE